MAALFGLNPFISMRLTPRQKARLRLGSLILKRRRRQSFRSLQVALPPPSTLGIRKPELTKNHEKKIPWLRRSRVGFAFQI